jgi:hypothetical protein
MKIELAFSEGTRRARLDRIALYPAAQPAKEKMRAARSGR